MLGFQPFLDGFERPLRLAVIHAHAAHDAVSLGLDEDLAVLALPGADLVAECVVGADEPFTIPAGVQDGFPHLVDVLLGLVRLVRHALMR